MKPKRQLFSGYFLVVLFVELYCYITSSGLGPYFLGGGGVMLNPDRAGIGYF